MYANKHNHYGMFLWVNKLEMFFCVRIFDYYHFNCENACVRQIFFLLFYVVFSLYYAKDLNEKVKKKENKNNAKNKKKVIMVDQVSP